MDTKLTKKLKVLTSAVEAKMESLSKYGACDTEPSTELHYAMKKAMTEGIVELPKSWQLYTASMKCGTAERQLNAVVKPLLVFLAENHALNAAVEDYCWRAY